MGVRLLLCVEISLMRTTEITILNIVSNQEPQTKEELLIPSNNFVARLELELDFCLMIFQLLHDIFSFFIDENVRLLFTANVI